MASRRRPEPDSRSKAEPESPSIWALAWNQTDGLRTLTTLAEVRRAYDDASNRLWIDLESPDRALLDGVATVLGIHPLVSEDILERNQRAKLEEADGFLHIVMFALAYEGEIVSHELDVVLGSRFVLTSHDQGLDMRNASFRRRDPSVHLDQGTDFCLWVIADWLVDDYFPVFDRLGDEIDQLEDDVMRRPTNWIVERLFTVRRDLLTIRHVVMPQREVFNQLTNRDLKLIQAERVIYFRDVYDHLIRLTDELDSYRELVSTALDIYLSQVNNNLSETVKKLTVATVLLAGAGAVAGIFGMSEVALALDFTEPRFWLVVASIAILVLGGWVYFKRIGWI
jgi:magnesium transporter